MDQLLDTAYRMIDTYERRAERQADHIALESAMAAFTETDLQSERTRSFDGGSLSDQDSFVSATDVGSFLKKEIILCKLVEYCIIYTCNDL